MAKRVRLKLDKKGVGQILRGEDGDPRLREALKVHADRVQRAMEADPDLGRATVDRRSWTGFDRMRESMGVPGSLEAKHGIGARALGRSGG